MNHQNVTIICLIPALPVFFLIHPGYRETQSDVEFLNLDQKWTGDFDGMVDRRTIRALVPYSKTFYFLDGLDQHGLSYEILKQFEKTVNKRLKK